MVSMAALDLGPDNVWLWPSAVLVDSFSYSDGSIFPQAYQDQKIGKLIGDVLLNTGTSVIAVNSKVLPGLQYNFPVMPYRHVDGRKYENEVITPDIVVPLIQTPTVFIKTRNWRPRSLR